MRKRIGSEFRVLILGTNLEVGGDTISTVRLARGLQSRGHQVFYMSRGGILQNELAESGIPHIDASVSAHNPLGLMCAMLRIMRFLRHTDVDVVHIQTASSIPIAYVASRTTSRLRPAVVWHNRGIRRATYLFGVRLFGLLLDFVISISDYERGVVIKHGLSPGKVQRVYHGIHLDKPPSGLDITGLRNEFGLAADAQVVAMISRFQRAKGHRYFLEAAASVSSEVPEARFLIVGGGPHRFEDELKSLATELKIREKVVFTGIRRDMYGIYSITDLVVHPSEWESLCNVLIEAMYMGKPIVTTSCAVMPEVVLDGRTGILVPPRDSARLAEGILRLLRDKKLAEQMGRAGRERAGRLFTIERQLSDVEEIYSSVCGKLLARDGNRNG